MNPNPESGDSVPSEPISLHPSVATSNNLTRGGSWLTRSAILFGLAAIAILGFGSSAGWFTIGKGAKPATVKMPLSDDKLVRSQPSGDQNQVQSNSKRLTERSLVPAPNLPPLGALVPDQSLEIIAECRRVAQHLQQVIPNSLDAREMQARLEFGLGDMEQSQAIWSEIIKVDPNYVHALRGLGDVCTSNGELLEAVKYFRRAVLADPRNLTRQITLGVALMQTGNVDQAAEVFQGVLVRDPAHVGAHAELGQALLQSGRLEQARTHFEAALKGEAQLADPSKAHFGLATVLQRLGEIEQAKVHLAEHSRLRSANNQKQVVGRRDYDDVKAISLDAARLYVDMARIYLSEGQPYSAELLLLRASRMNTQDVDCRQALAFMALSQGKPHDAIRWLRTIAELAPHDFVVVQEIARLYVQTQSPESAEKLLLEFLEAEPGSVGPLSALTEFYVNIKPDVDNAIRFAQDCVKAAPTSLHFANLATAHEMAKKPLQAIEALQRAVELDPGNALYSQRLFLLRDNQTTGDSAPKP